MCHNNAEHICHVEGRLSKRREAEDIPVEKNEKFKTIVIRRLESWRVKQARNRERQEIFMRLRNN